MDAHSSLRRKIQEDSLPVSILKVRILGDQPCSLSREKPAQSALDSLPLFEGRHGPADPRNEWSGGVATFLLAASGENEVVLPSKTLGSSHGGCP